MAGEILGGVRKAYASKGDDSTFTRFVKLERPEGKKRHQRRQPKLPGFEAPYIIEGRTKFPKSVKTVAEVTNLLVSGHSNVKIGRDVRKGKLRGYWIYTLSLEERKTCPLTCEHWQSCYGNNMPYAKRVDFTDPTLLTALEAELEKLIGTHGRKGILVRLHALGDFYSPAYVGFWRRMLVKHPRLAIYGYTARRRSSPDGIGRAIDLLNNDFGERCMIRWSSGGLKTMSTVNIGEESSKPADAFICPEQTGKTKGCGTCGLCWGTSKNVAFLEH
jgi:hypothetical protein